MPPRKDARGVDLFGETPGDIGILVRVGTLEFHETSLSASFEVVNPLEMLSSAPT